MSRLPAARLDLRPFSGVEGSGAWFLCQAVPIQSDGQVAAILYGLMDLERLPSF